MFCVKYNPRKTYLKLLNEIKMAQYYVSKFPQANGTYEVHVAGCSHIPAEENRIFLGDYLTCYPAVAVAQEIYKHSTGCFYCADACHID